MRALNPRKEKILAYIVDSYVESVNPVGSRVLSKRFRLHLSSSTIRNEMSDLEAMGYITHPHTSAGRIPTDKGYRYFVDHLNETELPDRKVVDRLNRSYEKRIRNAEELLEHTLQVLSSLSHQASMIFIPERESFVLKSVTLIRMEGYSLLVIWLAASGFTRTCLVNMGEHLSEEALHRLNRFLNEELAGLSYRRIREFVTQRLAACRNSLKDLYEKASQIVEGALAEDKEEKVYTEGSSRILEQPEFQDVNRARPVLNGLEGRKVIQRILREDLNVSGVRVRIGSENKDSSFLDCSLISAPYFQGAKSVGVLGILGPRRMQYGPMISLVSQVASLMGESLERWFK